MLHVLVTTEGLYNKIKYKTIAQRHNKTKFRFSKQFATREKVGVAPLFQTCLAATTQMRDKRIRIQRIVLVTTEGLYQDQPCIVLKIGDVIWNAHVQVELFFGVIIKLPRLVSLLLFCFTPLQVTLEESEGPWNMLHNMIERHHPKLKSEGLNDWYEKALDRMSERLLHQMHKLKVPLKNNAAVSGIDSRSPRGIFKNSKLDAK